MIAICYQPSPLIFSLSNPSDQDPQFDNNAAKWSNWILFIKYMIAICSLSMISYHPSSQWWQWRQTIQPDLILLHFPNNECSMRHHHPTSHNIIFSIFSVNISVIIFYKRMNAPDVGHFETKQSTRNVFPTYFTVFKFSTDTPLFSVFCKYFEVFQFQCRYLTAIRVTWESQFMFNLRFCHFLPNFVRLAISSLLPSVALLPGNTLLHWQCTATLAIHWQYTGTLAIHCYTGNTLLHW